MRRSDLQSLERRYELDSHELYRLIGVPPGTKPPIEPGVGLQTHSASMDKQSLINTAFAQRYEIKAYELAVQSRKESAKAVRAEGIPKVVSLIGTELIGPIRK